MKILIVDDELKTAGILKSQIEQLAEVKCTLCDSGSEALKILEEHDYELVITDKNMPDMDGLMLAKSIKERYPDIILILISGYPDLDDLTNAINDCGISYYISKPWELAEVKIILNSVIDRIHLHRQNVDLMLNLEKHNIQISKLNNNLEKSFLELIRLLSDIMAEVAPELTRHSQEVALLSKKVAGKFNKKNLENSDLEISSLLHDLGLIGFSKDTFLTPPQRLSGDLRKMYLQHPKIGAEMLKAAPRLKRVRKIILTHHENIDGTGMYEISGDKLCFEAKILRICDFYCDAVNLRNETHQNTLNFMKRREGTWFDTKALQAFIEVITVISGPQMLPVPITKLVAGMQVAKDIVSQNGHLILASGSVLTQLNLKRLKIYNDLDPLREIYITNENI